MSSFDKAFASARKSGKKVFSFGGKSYNTKLKGSDLPKKVDVSVNEGAVQRMQKTLSYGPDDVAQPSGPSQRGKGQMKPFKQSGPISRPDLSERVKPNSGKTRDNSYGSQVKKNVISFFKHTIRG